MTQHSLAKKSSGTLFQSGFPYFSRMTFTNCKDRMCIRIQNICKIQYKIEKKTRHQFTNQNLYKVRRPIFKKKNKSTFEGKKIQISPKDEEKFYKKILKK